MNRTYRNTLTTLYTGIAGYIKFKHLLHRFTEASFVFSSSSIKRITLPDIAPQEGEPLTEEEEANANLILSGTAVARIYEALTVELGGLSD